MNRPVTVTTWHLEMRDPAALRRARVPQPAPSILRAEIPSPALNRFLYTYVGGDWHWRDRLPWTWARWMQWLDRPQVRTWVMYVAGTPGGYFELERQPGDDVELAYFGLARDFVGKGLGGHLLTVAIEHAWAMGARRVWVHTCSLDHPAALANYRARGMTLFKTETDVRELPARSQGPWPGADCIPPPLVGGG
ncbi:MAG: GNAT family N-acetyltransferase [Gammaproteobacteria bacterium]|nr:GNAT family N-acetyltransferase [Gammaproteobacteria bacterium]